MDELNKNDTLTLLGKCVLDLSEKTSWWYSINDPDNEFLIASALDLIYSDYTSILLKLGLLQISRRRAKITTNKDVWVKYFKIQNIDNYDFECKKSSTLLMVKLRD